MANHVLIVEDDLDIRAALSDALESEGYDVACAANGVEGLKEAHRHHPDVILLDLMMPVMNGWQFREAQELDPTIRDVPVIIVTAHRQRSDVAADAFLLKPCNLADLLATVQQFTSPAAPGARAGS